MFYRISSVIILALALAAVACAPKKLAPLTTRYRNAEIHFHFDSQRVDHANEETLRAARAFLKKFPTAVILLEGRTDAVGSPDYNLDLGDRRARSVKAWLMANGIAAERIVTVSYGEAGVNAKVAAQKRRRVILRDAAE